MNDGEPPATAVRAFLSYSHKDDEIRGALVDHLALLSRQGFLSLWHDRQIDAGTAFDLNIRVMLDTADLVILLVSASFLASDYCYETEMSRALARHHLGKCHVVPVIGRACDWATAPFGRLTALPTDGKAVTDRRHWQDNDAALADVAAGLRRLITRLSAPTTDLTPALSDDALKHAVGGSVGAMLEQSVGLTRPHVDGTDPKYFQEIVVPLMREFEQLHEQYLESFRRYRTSFATATGPFDGEHAVLDQIRSDGLFYASQRTRVAELSLCDVQSWTTQHFVERVWAYLAGSVNDLTAVNSPTGRSLDSLDSGFGETLRTNWPRRALTGTIGSVFAQPMPDADKKRQAIAELDQLVFRLQQRYADVFSAYRRLRDSVRAQQT